MTIIQILLSVDLLPEERQLLEEIRKQKNQLLFDIKVNYFWSIFSVCCIILKQFFGLKDNAL